MSILTAFQPLAACEETFPRTDAAFKKMSIYWRTHFIPNACSTVFLVAAYFCWNSHSAVFQSRQNERLAWLRNSGMIWNGTCTPSIKERPLHKRFPSSPDSFRQKGLLAPQCYHASRISRWHIRKPSDMKICNWKEQGHPLLYS